jgi:hypothetical protein
LSPCASRGTELTGGCVDSLNVRGVEKGKKRKGGRSLVVASSIDGLGHAQKATINHSLYEVKVICSGRRWPPLSVAIASIGAL